MAENEDVFGMIPPQEGRQRASRWGGPAFGDDGGDYAYDPEVGYKRFIAGTDAVSEEAQRYGYMAGGAQYRPGAWVDQTRYDISGATERAARAEEWGSLGELSSAARGTSRDMQYLDQAAGGMSEDTWRLGRASAGETDDMNMLRSAGMGETDDMNMLRSAGLGETADARRLGQAADGDTEDMRLLGGAARGNAPSRAEILGKQMSDRALRSQVSAAGSVRGGPGATAAAYRYASQNAASQRADMNAGIQAERAAEMAAARHDYAGALGTARRDYAGVLGQGRSAYAGAVGDARMGYAGTIGSARRDYAGTMGASRGTYSSAMNTARGGYMGGAADIRSQDLTIRAQDLDLAKTQAGLDDAQRARNQQQEQFYEGMRADTKWKGFEADRAAYTGENSDRMAMRGMRNAEQAQDWSKTKDVMSTWMSGASSGMTYASQMDRDRETSDMRAKTGVQPVTAGSLAPLYAGGIFRTMPEEKSRQKEARSESIVRDFPEGDDDSPPKTRDGWLDDYMASERGPSVEKGAAGAPKGYAASRKGQPGYMFGESKPAGEQMAPGTSDWLRYGTPSEKERSTTTSDERAKTPAQQDAFKRGMQAAGGVRDLGDVEDWDKDAPFRPAPSMSDAIADKQREAEGNPTFHHDTPEEQGAIRARYFSDLARQADEMKAGMKQSLARGASVSRYEGEVDDEPSRGPAPWLVAEMEGGQRDVTMSDANAKIDAYISGLKQGSREQKQGFVDWDTADVSGYRKALLVSEGRDARANKRTTSKEARSALEEYEKDQRAGQAEGQAIVARAAAEEKARRRGPSTPRPIPSTIGDRPVERGAPAPVAPPSSFTSKPGYEHGQTSYQPITSDKRAKTTSAEDAAMAGAARSMKPSVYAYKSAFAERAGQQPGEVNVGPMAQNMAKDPVARTAIVKDGETGLLGIDKDKGMKVVMGSLASLQHQIDSLKPKKKAA